MLNQQDRISISKKVVQIPKEIEVANQSKATILAEQQKALDLDNANKEIFNQRNFLVTGYQAELDRLDGILRYNLVEQNIVDSAKRTLGNFFFPNQTNVPTPSIPDGVWKFLNPFTNNLILGKAYNETFGTTVKEQDRIDVVNSTIATIETFTAIQRSTGQSCAMDIIMNDPVVQAAGTAVINAVTAWRAFLVGTDAVIITTDPDPTRHAQNLAAKADIANAIAIIDYWLALPDYDTNHGQTTCAGFNAYNVFLLNPTKFRADELDKIKNEATARTAFIAIRVGQITTNLGTVVQNFTTGAVTSYTGLYGERYLTINLRINAVSGSLTKYFALFNSSSAQDNIIDSALANQAAYDLVLRVSKFRSPSIGSNKIHVLSTMGFAVSNSIYVVADDQTEISTIITAISGNMVELATTIPAKYTTGNFARLYKTV